MHTKNLLSKETLYQVLRFVIVGVLATGIHYGVYWALKFIMNYNIAYTLGYIVSFIGNLFLTAHFTFKKDVSALKSMEFGGAHLCNYIIQMILMNVVIGLGVSESWAPIPVYCFSVPLNFLMVRYIFNQK